MKSSIKKLAVVALTAAALIGCEATETESKELAVSAEISSETAKANDNVKLTFSVESEVVLTAVDFEFTLLDSTGAVHTVLDQEMEDEAFPTTWTKAAGASELSDEVATFVIPAEACNGDFNVKVIATTADGSQSVTKKLSITGSEYGCVEMLDMPEGSALEEMTIEVGGHSHATLGSSFDLDEGTVLLSAAAKADGSGADLVYTFSGTSDAPVLMTPKYTKEESNISAFAAWENPNATMFHLVDAAYADITTAEEVEALFDATKATEGKLNAPKGSVFVVKTDMGTFALIEMGDVSTDASGVAKIKFSTPATEVEM